MNSARILVRRIQPLVEVPRSENHGHPVMDPRHQGVRFGRDDGAGLHRPVSRLPEVPQTREVEDALGIAGMDVEGLLRLPAR